MLEALAESNNEVELFEQLLDATLAGNTKEAMEKAARIQAARDIRFDVLKVINDHDNNRVRTKKTS